MQITKLRFFISLVVEQRDNDNIQTLPNLETKFTCANTLIDNPDPTKNTNNFDDAFNKEFKQLISNLANQLKDHRSKIFNTPDRKKKLKLKEQDSILRNSIAAETKKKIDQYRNSKIEKCNQEIANAQKAIDDLLAQPDDTRTEVYVAYNIFGDKEEKKRKISKRKDEIEKFRRIKADWERKLQLFADGGQFQPYQTYAERLCEWNPYDMSADNCSFFDAEWMFGVKDGFDIVIGNPPYIQLQNNGGFLAQEYEKCGFEVFAKTGDIYCLFYERAYQLLYEGGICCFITSNKWMRAAYGEKLREYFVSNTNPVLLIDFAGVKIFNSATVDTNILLSEKSANRYHTDCCITKTNTKYGIKNLSLYVKGNSAQCEFRSSDSWVILSPIEQSIKQKIEAVGTPLKDWDIQINYGIKTGFNDAFIISTEKRDEILAACKTDEERTKTAEIIRPILRGRDIKRYGYDWAGLWLVYIPWHFPLHKDTSIQGASEKAEQAFKKQYPAIYQHLSQYKKQLSARNKAETGIRYEWYAMQRWGANYSDDFNKPKIMYPNMTKFLPFYFDTNGFYQNDKSFMITGNHITFLIAFLNSSLFKYCFIDNFPELQGGTRELRKIFFDKIPVIKVDQETDSKFKALVDDIQKEYTREKAIKIDNIMFDMYGLTEEEKRTIGFVEIK
ncbi:MAG: Eco57I restriction-modification methylase domain-containing protein [Bacteroidales bacterium]|nr:Eco57I restriction-modification methylase domain-containing protein [Bacteroidales bacterium]